MTLPAMPPLTDPVLIEKAARLLTPSVAEPCRFAARDGHACVDHEGRPILPGQTKVCRYEAASQLGEQAS